MVWLVYLVVQIYFETFLPVKSQLYQRTVVLLTSVTGFVIHSAQPCFQYIIRFMSSGSRILSSSSEMSRTKPLEEIRSSPSTLLPVVSKSNHVRLYFWKVSKRRKFDLKLSKLRPNTTNTRTNERTHHRIDPSFS